MSNIFISYSRKDIDFARKVVSVLAENNLDTWVDWDSIPKGEEWEREIYLGIEDADIFVFLISPDSVSSEICNREIAHAVKNHKRILPIVVRDAEVKAVPETISKLNWIFCRDGRDSLDTAIKEIHTTIHTDYEWLKYHKRLQLKALDWERRNDNSLLIRGKELREAEQQLATVGIKDPQPTDLQRQFVLASQRNKERQRRQITIGLSVGFVTLIVLSIFALTSQATAVAEANSRATAEMNAVTEANARATAQVEAEEQAKIALARSLAAQSELLINQEPKKLPLAVLLSLESYKLSSTTEGESAIRHGLTLLPKLVFKTEIISSSSSGSYYYDEVSNLIDVLAFSPDGHWLAVGTDEEVISVWDTSTWKEVMRVEPDTQNGWVAVIRSLAFSPDSKLLITGSDGGYAQVWDIASGQEISQINHNDQVFIAAFTPDGTRAISGAGDSIVVWDPKTGSQFYTLKAGTNLLSISPNGEIAATASNNQITVWKLATGQILTTKTQFTDGNSDMRVIRALAFSPNGSLIASSEGDSQTGWITPRPAKVGGKIMIWDPTTGNDIAVVQHGDSVPALAFSSDGTKLVTGSYDGTSRVWEASTGRPIREFSFQNPVGAVTFGKDDSWIVSSGFDGTARIWDANTGNEINRLITEQDMNLEAIAVSWDGKFVAGGNTKGQVWVWEIFGQEKLQFQLGKALTIASVGYSQDGQYITTGSWDRMARVWDLKTGQKITSVEHDRQVFLSTFSPNGKVVVSADVAGTVKVWDPHSGKELFKIPAFDHKISALAFSPDSQLLAVAQGTDPVYGYSLYTFQVEDQQSYLSIWDISKGQEVHQLKNASLINSVEFSSNGKWLVFGGDDQKMHIVDVSNWKESSQVKFAERVNIVAISPDSRLAIGVESCLRISMGDSTCTPLMKAWDISTATSVWQVKLEGRWVPTIMFSPDGSMLATSNLFLKSCRDAECKNTVQIWNTASGDLISQKAYEESFGILSVDFNSDNTLIASGGGAPGGEGWVDVWVPRTGENLSRFSYQQALSIAFSPADDTVAVGGNQDGPAYVKVFSLNTRDIIQSACIRMTRNLTPEEWQQYLGTLPYQDQEPCSNLQPKTPQPNGASTNPIVSSNGQFIVFRSEASNLVCDDTNTFGDIFLFDQATSLIKRVSVGLENEANGPSSLPSISADGHLVVFESQATNLVSQDDNFDCDANDDNFMENCTDIFLYDRLAGKTKIISVDSSGVQANNESSSPAISADGHYIVYSSLASNLVPNDTNDYADIFLHDTETGEIIRVSSSGTIQANGASSEPHISADGRYVLFYSEATNLDKHDDRSGWYLYDLQDRQVRRTSADWDSWNTGNNMLSGDGQVGVGIQVKESDGSRGEYELEEVILYDFSKDAFEPVSITENGEFGNRDSEAPIISANQRYVVFASESNDLVENDTNIAWDIFLLDRQTKKIQRISLAPEGLQASGHSLTPSISGDGQYIVFTSIANNLTPNDTNGFKDIFVYDRATQKIYRIEPNSSCE